MFNLRKIFRAVFTLSGAVMLVACNAPAASQPVNPTQDLGAVKTEAASTAVAQYKGIAAQTEAAQLKTVAAAQPTVAPTKAAPAATATSAPTATVVVTLAPTVTATKYVYSGPAVTAAPTKYFAEKAVLVKQTPADMKVLKPNEDFDMVWTFKNTGSRTWDAGYNIRYLKGEKFSGAERVAMPKVTEVGDTVDMRIDMKAPGTPGTYQANWAIYNDNGEAFFNFYVRLVVQ